MSLSLRLQSGGQALVSLEAGYSSHGQQGQAGPAPPNPQRVQQGHLRLHASRMSMFHVKSGTKIRIEAPEPAFLEATWQALPSQSRPPRTADPSPGSYCSRLRISETSDTQAEAVVSSPRRRSCNAKRGGRKLGMFPTAVP